jgi:LCP family protein required for cell wall assembly
LVGQGAAISEAKRGDTRLGQVVATTEEPLNRSEYRHSRGRGHYLRRLLYAFCSMLVPGTGQIAAGARRRGYIMLAVVAFLVIVGIVVLLQGIDEVVAFVIQPTVLLALLALNVVLLAFRLYAAVDAYLAGGWKSPREAAPSRSRLVLAGIGLAAVLLLTVAPHGVVGYYTFLSHDLLTSVFVTDEETTTTTAPPPSTTTLTAVARTTTTNGATSTTISTTTTSSTTTTTVPPLEQGDDDRLTFLLLGTDAGWGRSGARADTIMVATVDLKTGAVAIFGIPRNTGSVALSGRAAEALGTDVYADLISSLYFDAQNHPELAVHEGDAGAQVMRDAVSNILGIPIDYYAVVDLNGFIDLVNAFDGVTLNVRERIWVRMASFTKGEDARVYDIQPGIRHLDGWEALAFARSRTGSDDYHRMQRQRCVVLALLYQNGVTDLALKFPDIVGAIKDNLKTDIPIDSLAELIKVRAKVNQDEMVAVGFTPPDYITGRNELGYNILDLELVRSTVQQVIDDPQAWLASHPANSQAGEENPSDCWKVDD